MKNSLKNFNLWQKKRAELPLKDEPQTDWLQMQAMLNARLPVVPGSHALPKVSKVAKFLKGIKGSSLLFTTLSAAALVGVISYAVIKKQNPDPQKHHKEHVYTIHKDSLSDTSNTDSLNLADSSSYRADSLTSAKTVKLNADSVAQKPNTELSKNDVNVPNNNTANKPAVNSTGSNNAASSNNTSNNNVANNASIGKVKSVSKNMHAFAGLNSRRSSSIYTTANNAVTHNRQSQQAMSGGNAPINQSADNCLLSSNVWMNNVLQPASNSISTQQLQTNVDIVQNQPQIFANQPASSFIIGDRQNAGGSISALNKAKSSTNKQAGSKTADKAKKTKSSSNKISSPGNLDWGILAGVNTSGSFTPKKQNANIYGSLPADLYFGLYGTYHLNDKWAVNMQAKVLNPQNISGSYTHNNSSKVDSGRLLTVTDSRKAYFVSVPIHVVYKVNNNFSIKGGPVVNIPVKQVNGTTSLQPATLKKDTAYYTGIINQLNATKYDQKINLGVSGGVSLQYNRLLFEATYMKTLSGYKVNSGFGSYKANSGSLQITIGFQLNRVNHH